MNRKNQGQQGQNRRLSQPSQFHEGKTLRSPERGNYSGMMNTNRWDEDVDTDMGYMGSSDYRDTDYDQDGSIYGRSQRASRPSNERDFSNRAIERQASSSERFGYPATMNAWAHSDRSYGHSYGEGSLDRDYDTQYGQSQATSQASGFFGKGPKGYRRSDDRIKEEVCETLSRHPRIDASDIEVKVEEACVTLSGTVESKEIRRAAEMAIENLSGVDDVKNELRVKKAEDSIFASSSGARNTSANSRSTSSSKGTSHL